MIKCKPERNPKQAILMIAVCAAVFLGAAGNPLFFGLAVSAICLLPCLLFHRGSGLASD